MEYLDLDVEVARLNLGGDWGRAVEIVELTSSFKDMRLFRDGTSIRYCAGEVNKNLHSVDIRQEGDLIVAMPFAIIKPSDTPIYSDPPRFVVATQNQNGFGLIPVPGWEDKMAEVELDQNMIRFVRRHLLAHCQADYL